jgi:hypothetical protein
MAGYSIYSATHRNKFDSTVKSIRITRFFWQANTIKQASEIAGDELINVDCKYHSIVDIADWACKDNFTVYQGKTKKDFWIVYR